MSRVGVGNFRALVEAGKVKALGVSAAKRTPLMPSPPTFAEAGLGGYPGSRLVGGSQYRRAHHPQS